MMRIKHAKPIGTSLLVLICMLLIGRVAAQQLSPEIDAVKSANQAFYSAFSARDIAAMQKVWSSDPDDQNIGPASKSVTTGWDKIGKGFDGLFDTYPELTASMEPKIEIVGAVAWATGIEQVQRKDKAGASSGAKNLVTNIFQKQDGRWLMVHHHASRIPQ
jgi:ketosteroid isomerase-like protein